MTPKTLLLILHLLGVVCGVGGVLMLDVHLLRHLRGGRVTRQDLGFTRYVSAFVKAGLVLVWLSGILVIAAAPDGPAAALANPKLQAKLVVVVVLTINALFVETLALPLMEANLGRPLFSGVGPGRRSAILACGAVSTTSWLCPVVLGLARELNGVVPAQVVLAYYAAALAALMVAVQAAGRWLYRPLRAGADLEEAAAPSAADQDGRNRAARAAGSRSIGSEVRSDEVEGRLAALSSDDERQHFLTGMFDGLIQRHDGVAEADRLFEVIADDQALSRKFEAAAPDAAARGAFSRELTRLRARPGDDRWAQVWDWHKAVSRGSAAGHADPAAKGGRLAAGEPEPRRYAVGGGR